VSGGYGKSTERNPGGPSTEVKNTDYLKGYGQWNHLLTERFYVGLRLAAEHDDIADLDYRVTISPLAGYYIIKKTNTTLAVEAGPSLVIEKQGGDEKTYAAARLAERYEYKFPNDARIWQSVEWLPQVDDFDNWVMNAELGVSAPLVKGLDVRVLVQDTYDREPAPGRLKNDLKLIAGIGYKF
jgi:putative salt-induced outer membrane protein YdiY